MVKAEHLTKCPRTETSKPHLNHLETFLDWATRGSCTTTRRPPDQRTSALCFCLKQNETKRPKIGRQFKRTTSLNVRESRGDGREGVREMLRNEHTMLIGHVHTRQSSGTSSSSNHDYDDDNDSSTQLRSAVQRCCERDPVLLTMQQKHDNPCAEVAATRVTLQVEPGLSHSTRL